MKFGVLAILFCLWVCCKEDSPGTTSSAFEIGQKLGEVTDKKLKELSGLAMSANNPDFFWTHNDSGNKPEVYLIDKDVKIHLAVKLEGIKNRDWEDIAVGPGPDSSKTYVYIGDIGDNNAKHQYKMIYRFEEPVLDANQSTLTITNVDTIVFQLEDKKKDTETLMIDPATKDIYVVSKREKPVVVYRLPFPGVENDTLTAEAVAEIYASQIVGGDFSADGKEVLLKNYQNVYYWTREGNETVDQMLKVEGQTLPYAEEPQGEAITFARDGSGYYTISEVIKGERSYLQFYKRK